MKSTTTELTFETKRQTFGIAFYLLFHHTRTPSVHWREQAIVQLHVTLPEPSNHSFRHYFNWREKTSYKRSSINTSWMSPGASQTQEEVLAGETTKPASPWATLLASLGTKQIEAKDNSLIENRESSISIPTWVWSSLGPKTAWITDKASASTTNRPLPRCLVLFLIRV